tara:strand:+ start:46 stop:1122 length:1077 start_codon:yes stop_codon:yes gene_type:complete
MPQMTDSELRNFLQEIGHLFFSKKIGKSGKEWIVSGHLLQDVSLKHLEQELKHKSVNVKVKNDHDDVTLFIEENKVVLTIPEIPRINIILFFITILTTLFAGAMMEGADVFQSPLELTKGFPFSVTLMLILGTHEFGHYFYAQKHKVDATLPYFIPAPPFLFLIGTFGAFIKIKSPITKKSALLQIGAAGPIAGFIVAVPALVLGLTQSTIVSLDESFVGMRLGDSLLMVGLTGIIFPGLGPNQDILLHSVAFAGWIGLLVTMLNLLPIGQLDGGHIAYAMLGDKYNKVAIIALLSLIPLSILSLNWLVWGALILILMRTIKHPPVMNIHEPLSQQDKTIGYICVAIFILCFIPVPIR